MSSSKTLEELEHELGERLKRSRLNKNWDQKTLAARAGVSVRALRNIEAGQGSTIKTLLAIVRALGREAWLETIAPIATVNPLTMTTRASVRVRASSPMVKINAAKRLIADAQRAEDSGLASPYSPIAVNAARRLLASVNLPGEVADGPRKKSK